MRTMSDSINQWYAENIDRFPELMEGECPYCGVHPMMIDYEESDELECYHCGEVVKEDDQE